MNKAVVLLALMVALTGCQTTPPSPQEELQTSLRCRLLRDQKTITPEQVEYIRESSENGYLSCTLMLGDLYERGHGVPQDIQKARAFYQAVAVGKAAGYVQLGRMAEEGVGQAPDLVEARGFYQRAVAKDRDPDNEAKLAEFMEYGKGGPQDLNGALAYYLNAARLVDDAPWKSVQRLRDKGLALTAEQATHYNEIWIGFFKSDVGRKILDDQQALAKQFKPGSASQPVTLKLIGNPGSVVPQVSVLESSGNSAIDQAALKAMSDYRFYGEPILPAGQKTWQASVDVEAGVK
ncbi:MAG: sel1 repeat family protein [Pseudomonas sp.]